MSGEVLPGWNVIGGYAFMPYAKITKDSYYDDPAWGGSGELTPGNTGKRLYLAPKHQVSLWTTYQLQCGDLRGLKLGAGVVGVSQRQGDPSNSFILPGYATVNLMASYGWKVGSKLLTAQLNVDNLFDRNYYVGTNSWVMITPGAPLSAKASLKAEF